MGLTGGSTGGVRHSIQRNHRGDSYFVLHSGDRRRPWKRSSLPVVRQTCCRHSVERGHRHHHARANHGADYHGDLLHCPSPKRFQPRR